MARTHILTPSALLLLLVLVPAAQRTPVGRSPEGPDVAAVTTGECFEAQQLLSPSPEPNSLFGYDVASNGSEILVSQIGDASGSVVGAVHTFTRRGGTWQRVQSLQPASAALGILFGRSVAAHGNAAMITSFGKFGVPPATYVFDHDGSAWVEGQRLDPPDPGDGDDDYGVSNAIHGELAVVGAWFRNGNRGSAFVYGRDASRNWTNLQELTADDAMPLDFFGSSVDTDGESFFVGAEGADVGGQLRNGAAYVFERSGSLWSQTQKLTPSNAERAFGRSLSVSGSTLALGAPLSGAVYVFEKSGAAWVERQRLVAEGIVPSDWFGHDIALGDGVLAVGAPNHRSSVAGLAGSVFLFTRVGTSWVESRVLNASDGTVAAGFGGTVDLAGDTVVSGAEYGASSFQGAAYLFPSDRALSLGRNASANPSSYTALPPRFGSMWTASVDLTASGHAWARIFGFTSPAAVTLPGGQVQLGAGTLLFQLPAQLAPLATWSLAIPDDCSLVGMTAYTQALLGGNGLPFALSNAQDLTVGY